MLFFKTVLYIGLACSVDGLCVMSAVIQAQLSGLAEATGAI